MGASILWRRLDVPGHDACRLVEADGGWILDGAAALVQDGVPARLAYRVGCDRQWRTRRGRVEGWIGARSIDLAIERTEGGWSLGGADVPGLEGCVDLDLGFTPATNLIPIRRLALAEGERAEASAAWLDVSAGALAVLPQAYERRSGNLYRYEAPSVGYEAVLEVGPEGFVRRYPGLWEAEP